MNGTILITGATDGIGLALARIYSARGARLVLVGRRPPAEFDPMLVGKASYCQVDLADPNAADAIVQFLDERGIEQIDLLIHNAGIGYIGKIAAQSSANIRSLVAVNLVAPLALTHALVPRLRLVRGKVVLISSVVSALSAPTYAVYAATKAALDGLARNLRIEWGKALAVQVIHPGATRTEMHRKAGGDPERMGWARFPPAEQVALNIANAIATSHPSVTLGIANQAIRFAGVWLGGVVDRLLAWQAGKGDIVRGN